MSVIDDGFTRVESQFQQMIKDSDDFAGIISSKIDEFRKVTEPLSNADYNAYFDMLEQGRNFLPGVRQQVERLRTMTEEYNKNINRIDKLLNELAKMLNENKFEYGLQGQMKKLINNLPTPLPPGIPDVVNDTYNRVPYSPRSLLPRPPGSLPSPGSSGGGKKSLKRLRRKLSKKLRKK